MRSGLMRGGQCLSAHHSVVATASAADRRGFGVWGGQCLSAHRSVVVRKLVSVPLNVTPNDFLNAVK